MQDGDGMGSFVSVASLKFVRIGVRYGKVAFEGITTAPAQVSFAGGAANALEVVARANTTRIENKQTAPPRCLSFRKNGGIRI